MSNRHKFAIPALKIAEAVFQLVNGTYREANQYSQRLRYPSTTSSSVKRRSDQTTTSVA